MAIPSGTGTEVLKSVTDYDRTTGTFTAIDLTATGIWTATVLSIIICNHHGSQSSTNNIIINNGTNDIFLKHGSAIPLGIKETFVWNDKFVLMDGWQLKFTRIDATGSYDTTVSYILQDWT